MTIKGWGQRGTIDGSEIWDSMKRIIIEDFYAY